MKEINDKNMTAAQKQTIEAMKNFIDVVEVIEKTSCEQIPNLVLAHVETETHYYEITLRRVHKENT